MEALDLKKFLWQGKIDKASYIILAITDYEEDDVVVYRSTSVNSPTLVMSVDRFCREFEATYDISMNQHT